MSIRPDVIVPPRGTAERHNDFPLPGRTPRSGAFSTLLASMGGNGGVPVPASVPPEAQAELIRLRMMRDALSISVDGPSAADGPAAPAVENLYRRLVSFHENSTTLPGVADDPDHPPVTESGTPPAAIPGSFSARFDDIIQRASRRYGVDAGLIRAVIKAESNFNPGAVSPAGARGLMQLMPGTARDLGVTDSFDPEQNIMAGTRFLRQMLDRYNGDLDSALAAYNWGPGNVDRKWHSLPRETRNYLSTVKGYYSSFVG